MVLYLAITTVYGLIMWWRGHNKGVETLCDILVDAGLVKSRSELHNKLAAHYESLDEDDSSEDSDDTK